MMATCGLRCAASLVRSCGWSEGARNGKRPGDVAGALCEQIKMVAGSRI